MFEKLSTFNVDIAGNGGEYTGGAFDMHLCGTGLTKLFIDTQYKRALDGRTAYYCGLYPNMGRPSTLQTVLRLRLRPHQPAVRT
jgi:hypothetical protein